MLKMKFYYLGNDKNIYYFIWIIFQLINYFERYFK